MLANSHSLLPDNSKSTLLLPVEARGMLSLPTGRQGLIVHFDRLGVLSLSKEAASLTPI